MVTGKLNYRRSRGTVTGFVLLLIGVVLLGLIWNIGLLALGIWGVWFGIYDIITVGFNGWALAWLILGAIDLVWLVGSWVAKAVRRAKQ